MHTVIAIQLENADIPTSPVLVKLSGDGAHFSKTSNFILFSFSFPALTSNALAAAGMF